MGGSEPASARRTGGELRTGFSTDAHPFGPGDGLWLGGVEIPAAPRLHGHSDGDAALHAIAGALLGGGGLGDLGTVYPADERTPARDRECRAAARRRSAARRRRLATRRPST